jgi:serine/threonine-protein kinase
VDRERWRQIEAVFQASQGQPTAERAAFLKQACGGDAELRREVESLLRAATDTRFLELPLPDSAEEATVASARAGTELLDRLQRGLGSTYRVERELGGGGMARIFVATDTSLGRQVVLKVLIPELAAGVNAERFHREVRLAASLQHPHIVPLLAAGHAQGLLYYTMPFVVGESLRQRLDREGPLPVTEVVRLLREITDAMGFAHGRRIIHRDLKPANILLSEGHALVADFGIGKALAAATASSDGLTAGTSLTSTGLIVGTPAYMAPEQAASDQSADHRADLYALGCLAYELLTGRPPFQATSVRGLLTAHLIESPEPVNHRRPEVPLALADLIMRLLAKDPAQRPQRARDVLTTLDTFERSDALPSRAVAYRAAWIAGVLYLIASATVLGVTHYLITVLGLPDWVMPGAVLLLVIGLPIILVTAAITGIQLGTPTDARLTLRRAHWLTWKRALAGGGLAFSGLGVATIAYMVLRATGVGPLASLLSAGVIRNRERVLIAEFENHTRDSLLSRVVSDAFRIDLSQSAAVTVVPEAQSTEVLALMQRPPTTRLDLAVAREVAMRDGIKAVVSGSVAAAGGQYILSAELVAAATGEVLAGQRETARDSTTIITAVDRLSRKLRERIGESLRVLRSEAPLERVTTASPGALRKYVQAVHAGDHQADWEKAIQLLKEAVALDSGFAMAYRTLAVYLRNNGEPFADVAEAAGKALAHQDRLTERERQLMLADYYWQVTFEYDKAVTAFRALLDSHPNDRDALNNLGVVYTMLGENNVAESMFRRAIAADSLYLTPRRNLVGIQVTLNKRVEAQRTLQDMAARNPDNPTQEIVAYYLASSGGDYRAAEVHARALEERHGTETFWRASAHHALADLALVRGKVGRAAQQVDIAMEAYAAGGAESQYVTEAVSRSFLDAWFLHDPGRAIRTLDAALARFPLAAMKPSERPYLSLAWGYAAAGKPKRGRDLLGEYERMAHPGERRRDEGTRHWAWGWVKSSEGRIHDALDEFRAQVVSMPFCQGCGLPEMSRAYDGLGETDSVIAVLERYVHSNDLFSIMNDATELAPAYKRLGELYDRRGDHGKAKEYYARFVALWKDCDPELRPQVETARRRLAELAKAG